MSFQSMKIGAIGALIVLLAWSAAAPGRVAAQEVTQPGVSPDLHAAFECEYALEATAMSVAPAHRKEVAEVINAYASGNISQSDASKRIDSVLTPDERGAVSEIERSFFASMQQIYANASNRDSMKVSVEEVSTQTDPGGFLLLLFGLSSPSPATVQ